MTEVRTVGVVGAGLMGSGIAQVAAVAGFPTVLRDVASPLLAKAEAGIRASLGRFVAKGTLAADAGDAALGRLTLTTDLDALASCDLVIEAITEDLALKQALFRDVEPRLHAHALLASNTSSLSIVDLAMATGRPDRFVGLHFFNPVPLMALVEVVRTVTTSAATVDAATAFVRALGKTPVVARDGGGFIVNRLLVPYLLDAVRFLEQGGASIPDIDAGMTLGAGHPMGPLTLLDVIGLDTVVRVAEVLHQEFRDPRFAPPPLLKRMVAAGWLGRKSGRGFYEYGGGEVRVNGGVG